MAKEQVILDKIRLFQISNYEYGLEAIEKALPADYKRDDPGFVLAYPGMDVPQTMDKLQKRLEVLQKGLYKREADVEKLSQRSNMVYFYIYIAVSLAAAFGAFLKVLDKLSLEKESNERRPMQRSRSRVVEKHL